MRWNLWISAGCDVECVWYRLRPLPQGSKSSSSKTRSMSCKSPTMHWRRSTMQIWRATTRWTACKRVWTVCRSSYAICRTGPPTPIDFLRDSVNRNFAWWQKHDWECIDKVSNVDVFACFHAFYVSRVIVEMCMWTTVTYCVRMYLNEYWWILLE